MVNAKNVFVVAKYKLVDEEHTQFVGHALPKEPFLAQHV